MLPEDKAATAVVDASYLIHTTWGPGLLESACSIALEAELLERGHRVAREVRVPVVWNDVRVEDAFRVDLVVDDCLIVELKSVEQTARVHKKQVITYLELTGMRLGLLVNFGEKLIRDGITRLANGMPWTGRQRPCASAALRGNSVGAATDPPRTRQPLVIATPTNGGLNQPDHHVWWFTAAAAVLLLVNVGAIWRPTGARGTSNRSRERWASWSLPGTPSHPL